MKRRLRAALIGALLCLAPAAGRGADTLHATVPPAWQAPLPRPPALAPLVAFWQRVYGEWGDDRVALHDKRHAEILYEVIEVAPASVEQRRAAAAPLVERYRETLRALADGRPAPQPYAGRVLAAWGEDVAPATLRAAADRVRVQLGHADSFQASMARAAPLRGYIAAVLQRAGLPLALAAIPHVESFYRSEQRSPVGALGIWQFTAESGADYLRVDAAIDERADPRKSSLAAAELLAHNLELTGDWPRAVTAYIAGSAVVRRAERELDSPDLGLIVQRFEHPQFGFASRNYYAQVLAAAAVDAASLARWPATEAPLPRALAAAEPITLPAFARLAAEPASALCARNPALSPPLCRGERPLPAGYPLWVACRDCRALASALAAAEAAAGRRVTVRAGESLSEIAARAGVRSAQLVALNSLASADRIRAGQGLRLPWPGAVPAHGAAVAVPAELSAPAALPAPLAGDGIKPARRHSYAALMQDWQAGGGGERHAGRYPSLTQYRVDERSQVRLQPGETIDHLAQWLGIKPAHLFTINALAPGATQAIGQPVTLIFDRVKREEFERRRRRHHRARQRAFYTDWRIAGERVHVMAAGDRLWQLSEKRYGTPLWLLLEYNPGLDFRRLKPGDRIRLPRIEARS